jgi:hypothetical protein
VGCPTINKVIEEITMMTKQPIVKKLNVPADVVWAAIRKTGALRYMTIADGGGDIKDTVEEVDDFNMKLVYLRPISPFPVTYYKGTVEVFKSYDGLGVVVWTIDFESAPENSASVAELVKGAISDGIDGMEKDLQSA